MENTLENEMLDAAISWCDSNGISVLEPEQLSRLVNSLYVTVCDAALDTAQPVQVNAMLVEALERIADPRNKHFAGDAQVVASAALTVAKQAQPELNECQAIAYSQLALQKLGARLAELLDEDQWAECEALLIKAGAN